MIKQTVERIRAAREAFKVHQPVEKTRGIKAFLGGTALMIGALGYYFYLLSSGTVPMEDPAPLSLWLLFIGTVTLQGGGLAWLIRESNQWQQAKKAYEAKIHAFTQEEVALRDRWLRTYDLPAEVLAKASGLTFDETPQAHFHYDEKTGAQAFIVVEKDGDYAVLDYEGNMLSPEKAMSFDSAVVENSLNVDQNRELWERMGA